MSDAKSLGNETLALATSRWIANEGGQESLEEALRKANETSSSLDRARKVDFEEIHRPLGLRF